MIEAQRRASVTTNGIQAADVSKQSIVSARSALEDFAAWWLEPSGKLLKANFKAIELQSASTLVAYDKAGEVLFAATPLHRYLNPDLPLGTRRTVTVAPEEDGGRVWRLDFQSNGEHILCQARPVDARASDGSVLLMSCFGLTWTEARVASLLLTGGETEVLAQKMGISVLTFRTHRKRVFAKMGVKARSALQAKVIAWLVS